MVTSEMQMVAGLLSLHGFVAWFATFDIHTVKGLLSLQGLFESAVGRNPVFGKLNPPF